jgi:hypothetical protein
MRLSSRLCYVLSAIGFVSMGLPPRLSAQEAVAAPRLESAVTYPEAPQPQFAVTLPDSLDQQPAPAPGQTPTGQESSSSQTPAIASSTEETQREKAEQQLQEEKKQRVLGVLPNFNITYRGDAVSLTAKQKISLALRSATDPVTFGVAIVVAGYGEAADSDSGFPWGAKGFGERAGAKYLDAFDGTMIGNGILPAILHQDPRYFRLGHGSNTHRLLYSVSTTFICKHDNTGKWEPNYSNVLGNIASGALSNFYYPTNDSGIGLTIGNGFIVSGEGALGAVFDEFWPDISRKLFHKDPTHGLDAEAHAADRAAKQAKADQK